jgi:PAS domain S-box-containing protein
MILLQALTVPEVQISFDVVALMVASVTAAIFLWRKALLPTIRGVRKILTEIDTMADSRIKINSIYNELHPNGGSSIRDAINRIEMRLVQVEQKQNVYLLESPQGIYETDSDGNYIGVNRTFLRMVARTEKEVLGRGWVHCIAEHDKDKVKKAWDEAVEHGMEFSMIYDMMDVDGEVFKVNAIAYPMESPTTKQIIGWLGTINKHHSFENEKASMIENKNG